MKGFRGIGVWGIAVLLALSVFDPIGAGAIPAAPVKLAWNATPDADVAGYKVCYGLVNSTVTNRIDVGTALQATIPTLLAATNYFFYVVAYATNQVESMPSNQLQHQPAVMTPVQLVVQDTGAVQVQFRGPANSSCTVQYTDSLQSPNWQVLGTMLAAADGSIAIDDPAPSSTGMRFYRAVYP